MTIDSKQNASGEQYLNSRGMKMIGSPSSDSGCCCKDCCIAGVLSGPGPRHACCFSKTSKIVLTLALTRASGTGCICVGQDFDVVDLDVDFYGCVDGNQTPIWVSQFIPFTCTPANNDLFYFYGITKTGTAWTLSIYSQVQGTPGKYPGSFGNLLFASTVGTGDCCGVTFTGVSFASNCTTTGSGSLAVANNQCCVSDIGGTLTCCECLEGSSDCETGLCDRDGDCGCECRPCSLEEGCPSTPDTLSVSLAGLTGAWSSVNGSYSLTRASGGDDICSWEYILESTDPCSLYSISLILLCSSVPCSGPTPPVWALRVLLTNGTGAPFYSVPLVKTWVQADCQDVYGTYSVCQAITDVDCGSAEEVSAEVS